MEIKQPVTGRINEADRTDVVGASRIIRVAVALYTTHLRLLVFVARSVSRAIARHLAAVPLRATHLRLPVVSTRFVIRASARILAAVPLCVASTFAHAAEDEPPRPNIVLILCDDLGYADVGFNGGTDITTPAIDALAKNGTVFTSAYVTHPFCGPSRMGLMTGRYPHAFGAPFNLPPTGLGIERYDSEGVSTDETLIGTVLQQAGYFTGAVGKWHLGFEPQFHPNNRGFDDFYGFLGGGHMYFPERYGPIYERQVRAGKKRFNEYITPLEHNGVDVKETEYMTDALSREAVRFVHEATAKKNPFFLYLSYNAPHTPLEAKDDDLARFAHIKDEKRRIYAAMVYAVDRGVGRLVEALQTTDSLDNTLIVFLSDNGGKIGAGANNAPLTEGKGSICEGGFRVPMFFHWPGIVTSGQRFDHPVSALDFYPTFARLAGAAIPDDKQLDGRDVWDAIAAGRNPRADEPIFALRHWNGFHDVGIRRNQWKASKRGNNPWKLFNLDDDIGEQRDLSRQNPAIVRQMVSEAQQWSLTHTEPRWFHSEKAEQSWKDAGMPRYDATFALTTSPRAASKPVKKQSPTDWTKQEFVAAEKIKWKKNGWRWNQEHIDECFREMDTDRNGLASAKERQAWYAKRAAEVRKRNSAMRASSTARRATGRPNILFCIADDWGPDAGAYGDPVVKTPAFDRLAREGVLFENAFVSAPSCTPSRNAILTGQWHWRLGQGANLWSTLHPKHPVFPLLLEDAGYHVGHSRKIWGPGDWQVLGRKRHPTGNKYPGMAAFLRSWPRDKPFCFLLGTYDPHRPFDWQSGAASGIDINTIRLPADLPDHEVVRHDVADYYLEVQRFDSDVAEAIRALEQAGELENTIVVMTGDHGMPFPRHKTRLYDSGTRVPLAVRWGAKVKGDRRVTDFVSLTDLAPTFLELAGVTVPGQMTGRSLLNVLRSDKSGRVDPQRDHVLTGLERHCQCQEKPNPGGYPSRAIRTDHYLYIRNFEPDRWPAGCPDGEVAFDGRAAGNYDGGPTKGFMLKTRDDPKYRFFYELAFARRPAEELYDLRQDPHQLMNVADQAKYAEAKQQLAQQLMTELKATGDPRVVGGEEQFDAYPYRFTP